MPVVCEDPNAISPGASSVLVALVGVLGFLALVMTAITLLRRAARGARAAKEAETAAKERKFSSGFAVVYGKVETDGPRPAVTVRIYQHGREFRTKTGMRHMWTELGRQIDARPFFLRMASGERVKVAPGESVRLVDDLGVEPLVVAEGAVQQRARTSKLSAGDYAYVCGRLEAPASSAAYRGAEEDFTLHPLAARQMVISAGPLGPSYARRARLHRGWAIACALAFLLANGVFLGGYWLEVLYGRPVAAKVSHTTWGKTSPPSFGVYATATIDGREVELVSETNQDCPYRVHLELMKVHAAGEPPPPGAEVDVPFLVVPFHSQTYELGTSPRVHPFAVVLALLVYCLAAGGYVFHAQRTLPWYDRSRVVDAGEGPLGFPDTLA